MIIDAIIILILLISILTGRHRGFLTTFLKLLGLVGGVVLGVMFTDDLAKVLYATSLDDRLIESLSTAATNGEIDLASYIPTVVGDTITALGAESLRVTVVHFTNVIINILSFALIVLVVWFLASLLINALRKSRDSRGLIGTVDASVGMLLGALKGVIVICLLLALLFPVVGAFMPQYIPVISEQLNSSIIAGRLYDMNPLLIFMKQLSL